MIIPVVNLPGAASRKDVTFSRIFVNPDKVGYVNNYDWFHEAAVDVLNSPNTKTLRGGLVVGYHKDFGAWLPLLLPVKAVSGTTVTLHGLWKDYLTALYSSNFIISTYENDASTPVVSVSNVTVTHSSITENVSQNETSFTVSGTVYDKLASLQIQKFGLVTVVPYESGILLNENAKSPFYHVPITGVVLKEAVKPVYEDNAKKEAAYRLFRYLRSQGQTELFTTYDF